MQNDVIGNAHCHHQTPPISGVLIAAATLTGMIVVGVAACCPWPPPTGVLCSAWTPRRPSPVVQIALLRSIPLFTAARARGPRRCGRAHPGRGAGQDSPHPARRAGDAYCALAGQLDVFHDGRFVRRCGRGEGVGKIAPAARRPSHGDDHRSHRRHSTQACQGNPS